MKVGFCGLGQMGTAMARRLLEAGHELAVWNRTPAKAAPLADAGATVAATPAQTAAGAEAVFTMLADPAALNTVMFEEQGLAAGLRPGTALIDSSTIGPDAIRSVATRLGPEATVLDCPVLGSIPQAEQGTLKVFAGGPAEALARFRPVLEALGTVFPFGPLGSGQAMKLVANSTLGGLMTTLGEAVALAQALGLDLHQVFDVLVASPIGVTATGKRSLVESGTYPPNFRLALAVKDLDLIAEAADRAGIELLIGEAARFWYAQALAAGLGDLDYSAVVAAIAGLPASLP